MHSAVSSFSLPRNQFLQNVYDIKAIGVSSMTETGQHTQKVTYTDDRLFPLAKEGAF